MKGENIKPDRTRIDIRAALDTEELAAADRLAVEGSSADGLGRLWYKYTSSTHYTQTNTFHMDKEMWVARDKNVKCNGRRLRGI